MKITLKEIYRFAARHWDVKFAMKTASGCVLAQLLIQKNIGANLSIEYDTKIVRNHGKTTDAIHTSSAFARLCWESGKSIDSILTGEEICAFLRKTTRKNEEHFNS